MTKRSNKRKRKRSNRWFRRLGMERGKEEEEEATEVMRREGRSEA